MMKKAVSTVLVAVLALGAVPWESCFSWEGAADVTPALVGSVPECGQGSSDRLTPSSTAGGVEAQGSAAGEAEVSTSRGAPTHASQARESRLGYSGCLQVVKAALALHMNRVTFPLGEVTDAEFAKVARWFYSTGKTRPALLCDQCGFERFENPQYAWGEDEGRWFTTSVGLSYFLTKKQVSAANRKVRKIARSAVKHGGRSARIRYVHDYLVRQTAYATVKAQWPKIAGRKRYSTFGVLCKHRGTCYGYSAAFARVLAAAGVRGASLVVVPGQSEGESHAINKVGKRYYDVTWDDTLSWRGADRGRLAQPGYRYFAKTKRQMQRLGYRL